MSLLNDHDPTETKEWLDSLSSLIKYEGNERAQFIIQNLLKFAYQKNVPLNHKIFLSPYCNTISAKNQEKYPGDLELEKKLESMIRWNAIAMVLRAKKEAGGVGGHLSSYAS